MSAKSRISSKGQVTVPAQVRRYLQIREGDEIYFVRRGTQVFIERVPARVRADDLFGALKRPGQGFVDLDQARKSYRRRRAQRYLADRDQR